MKYDSLIFDLDGTLWNTLSTCTKAWNEGLKSLDIDDRITTDDLKRVVGQPWNKCAKLLFPEHYKTYPNLFKSLDSYERKAISDSGEILYNGVLEGLSDLSNNYELFLISNCQGWYLKEFFKQSNIKYLFQDFNCFGNSNKSKYQMIVDMVNKHQLKRPMYIGDTEGDQRSAEKAGVDFIHAAWGYGKIDKKYLSFDSFIEFTNYFYIRK